MNKKVVITGGSGFLGTLIGEQLLSSGFDVVSLDIAPPQRGQMMFVEADLAEGIPEHHYLEKPNYVINLAGEPIFGRWNTSKKELIYNSRIDGTRNLVKFFKNPIFRPEALVSASAIGIYGDSGTVNVDERSDLGDNFLARVARDWEASAREAESYGVRTTIIRNGHIIGLGGLMKVFKSTTGLRIVPRPINGQVCFSWIHQYDAVKIYLEAMAEPLAPPVINAVAPRISTYGEFSREIARQTKSKVIPVPVEVSKLFLGDFVSELSLSQCVKSKMLSSNFKFKYGSIEKAIKEVLKN